MKYVVALYARARIETLRRIPISYQDMVALYARARIETTSIT